MAWNYGKYRRHKVEGIPTDYLLWFIGHDGAGWASPKRKHRIIAMQELNRRGVAFKVENRATELAARKMQVTQVRAKESVTA